jgi:ribonuclease/clavin/mitogillin
MLDFGKPLDSTGGEPQFETLYPGHGDVVTEGKEIIEMYIKHRLEREARILEVLRSSPTSSLPSVDGDMQTSEGWAVWDIVQTMYKGYPENLWEAAAGSIVLHLRKLQAEGRTKHLGEEGRMARWTVL